MKSKLLFLLLLLGSSYITAQTVIENPPFETRRGSIHTISKIELSPTETRLTIRTVFRPQWWTSLDSLDLHLRSRKQKATVSPAHRGT